MSRVADHRESARQALVRAARAHLTRGDSLSSLVIRDICEQIGIHPRAFTSIYDSESAFMDDISAALVEECRVRLLGAVRGFHPGESHNELRAAAMAIAEARPLTRAGFLFRFSRRQRALTGRFDGLNSARAERQFTVVMADAITSLVRRLGRQLTWRPALATRIILDTYERSFESWLLDGHDEEDFVDSAYIGWTLPELLARMTSSPDASVDMPMPD